MPVSANPSAGVDWRAPYPGGWARNFRFGEWLGDPVTPLFETWFLPVAERSFWATLRRVADMPTPQPTYVVVHGWYFTSMNFWPAHAFGWLARLARHPMLLRVLFQFNPALADWALRPWVREWQSAGLPRYRAIVEHAEEHVDRLRPHELVQLVEHVAEAAGNYFVWIALVAGAGYKTEAPLARFYRRHLYPTLGGSHQQLLAGLAGPAGPVAAHAVHSLDWSQPTVGEMVLAQETVGVSRNISDRATAIAETRQRAEADARAVLARQARRSRMNQFERVLANAQRYARLREEIVSQFTLGWPVLRRAVRRLGEELAQTGALDNANDVFFLTQQEVIAALRSSRSASLEAQVVDRRRIWTSQRLLVPPLVLGEVPRELGRGIRQLETTLAPGAGTPRLGVRGLPASAGRAIGPARIIRSPAEFDRLQVGDVLVASATTPAWTPLFHRAAAVITDTGSILAHASLVAREYGIPAVVGTGDATIRLRDGQQVLVDGMTGIVEVRSESAR
jgi:rifampicin phosphotransferase